MVEWVEGHRHICFQEFVSKPTVVKFLEGWAEQTLIPHCQRMLPVAFWVKFSPYLTVLQVLFERFFRFFFLKDFTACLKKSVHHFNVLSAYPFVSKLFKTFILMNDSLFLLEFRVFFSFTLRCKKHGHRIVVNWRLASLSTSSWEFLHRGSINPKEWWILWINVVFGRGWISQICSNARLCSPLVFFMVSLVLEEDKFVGFVVGAVTCKIRHVVRDGVEILKLL